MEFNLKLFLLFLISILLAGAAAGWAAAEGNMFRTAYYGSGVIVLGVITIGYTLQTLGNAGKTENATAIATPRKSVIIVWRASFGLLLAMAVVMLVSRLVTGAPLYLVLGSLWLMVLDSIVLLFTPLFLQELGRIRYPIWLVNWLKKTHPRSVTVHKEGKPYKFKITGGELKYLWDMLSCPTCKFYNEEASQKGIPWCNAPHPPDIEDNYCNTFEQINK